MFSRIKGLKQLEEREKTLAEEPYPKYN